MNTHAPKTRFRDIAAAPQEIEAYVDAAAAALALPLDPAHRPGVVHYFALAAAMAEQVGAEPLGLDDEPAAVFTAIGPDDLPAAAPPPR
jgi:hypothetical protein